MLVVDAVSTRNPPHEQLLMAVVGGAVVVVVVVVVVVGPLIAVPSPPHCPLPLPSSSCHPPRPVLLLVPSSYTLSLHDALPIWGRKIKY